MVHAKRVQHGVALLLFLLVVFGIAATFSLSALNQNAFRLEQESRTEQALNLAKEALIGDAVASTIPGRLRCPESISIANPIEGQAQGSCTTAASRIGRFPWKTLRLDTLRDGTGEPLWYALSPGFSAAPINSNTLGQLQVDGRPNAAVAVIVAPGVPLSGQSRTAVTPANPPQVSQYLDLTNSGGSAFVSSGPVGTINDRFVIITQAELFKAVNTRVLAELRGLDDQAPNLPVRGLRNYHNLYGTFPWADNDGDGFADANIATGRLPFNELSLDAWLTTNNWLPLVSYTRISANSAQLSIGTSIMKAVPCPALPCP